MDIFERIEKDHQIQRVLVYQVVESSPNSDKRRQLFELFWDELQAHAIAEESTFYASLFTQGQATNQSRHSIAEHHEALAQLEALQEIDIDSEQCLRVFKKLAHDNEHHMNEKETEVFPLVRRLVPAKEQSAMLPAFNDRKQQELSNAAAAPDA